ncbi:MAG: Hpt domain-containing protein [Gemmatimonas sp.]
MSAPQALIEFFQQEAIEYLDRLEQLLAASENACPDASAFLTHARALRGSATMTRLEALPDLAATVERIASGLRDGELRWDQRLHFAVHGALVELRDLVSHANDWTETEQRRSRTQSVALAAVAAGYLSPPAIGATNTPVVPISRFFPDDGLPGILERNPNPPFTLPQRFRSDIAHAGAAITRETNALSTSEVGVSQTAAGDALRRALLALSAVGESYGATSIAALCVTMARAPLESTSERAAVHALAHLMQDQERTDQELAARIKDATLSWPGRRTPSMAQTPSASANASVSAPAGGPVNTHAVPTPRANTPAPPRLVIRDLPQPTTPSASMGGSSSQGAPAVTSDIVPIESLLYSGPSALARAREVRDQLRSVWSEKVGIAVDPAASALLDELSDLLDLAVAH